MSNLNKNDLEKVINELFKFMEKVGIALSSEKKKEITFQLTNALDDKLSKDDVKDINVQKKLLSCISAKLMGDQKGFDATLNVLQSNKKDDLDKSLDLKLKAMFTLIISALKNKEEPNKKNENKKTPFEMMMELLKPKPKNEKAEPEPENELAKRLDETLRNLYGGNNPTVNGEIEFPVLGPIIGNAFGFTNQCSPDANSCAEMVDLITYNAGKVDPVGLENIARLADLEEGVDMNSALYSSPRPSPIKGT
ncbi:MAG TPA: hypothetical protein VFU82_03055 [Gammaproteobacteria bacterium]|nr:hypothetical protein [Gammaproteobacteria bacterium]